MSSKARPDTEFVKMRRLRDRALMLDARRRVRPTLRRLVAVPLAAPVPPVAPHGVARNGSPTDVILQGFHWDSHSSQSPNWYQILRQNAGVIKDASFDIVWFPPPSESADAEGYMPTRWNAFDSSYGREDDLRSAIAALSPVRALADVVVNHRVGIATPDCDFDSPPFPNQTGAVCSDDECGVGTGAADTGEHNAYARDLDHTAAEVQSAIIDYMTLLQTLGFTAWRYDEARGYHGRYAGMYNDATHPYLSVGEVWDTDRQALMNWIDATGGKSMAFDFPTRALLKDAIDQRLFSQLKTIDGKPTGAIGWWPNMCVTFLDDHDTAADHSSPEPFGTGDQVLQGYAYILTHPGIPCIFWSHFFDWGRPIQQTIKALIQIRKTAGLTNSSVVNIVAADDQQKYAAIIDNKVALKLGPAPWEPGAGWHLAVSGNDFAIWTP